MNIKKPNVLLCKKSLDFPLKEHVFNVNGLITQHVLVNGSPLTNLSSSFLLILVTP